MNSTEMKYLFDGQILVDLTGFIESPTRTGIPRTIWELLRNWPARSVLPVVLDQDMNYRVLPDFSVEEITGYFTGPVDEIELLAHRLNFIEPSNERVIYRMRQLVFNKSVPFPAYEVIKYARALFIPGIFFEPTRVQLYLTCGAEFPKKIFVLAYDMLLWLKSEYFPHVDWAFTPGLLEYLKVIRSVPNIATISHASAADLQKVRRRGVDDDIRVFPLGADTFRKEACKVSSPEVPTFCIVGTIEPRKHTVQVLEIFDELAKQDFEFRVILIGKMGWLSPKERRIIDDILAKSSWITWKSGLGDEEIARLISECTAGIYLAHEEGYGLPPLEYLHLGTPAIVSQDLPSLRYIQSEGQVRLSEVNHDSLRATIIDFLDREKALYYRNKALSLKLPTWKECSGRVHEWIEEIAGESLEDINFWERYERLLALEEVRTKESEEALMPLFKSITGYFPTLTDYEFWKTQLDAPGGDIGTLAVRIGYSHYGQIDERVMSIYDLLKSDSDASLSPPPSRLLSDSERTHELLIELYSYSSYDEFKRVCAERFLNRAAYEANLQIESKVDFIYNLMLSPLFKYFNNEELRRALAQDAAYDARISLFQGLEPQNFVKKLYSEFLGRPHDIAGFQNYLSSLSRERGRQDAIISILLSPEAMSIAPDLKALYRAAIRVNSLQNF